MPVDRRTACAPEPHSFIEANRLTVLLIDIGRHFGCSARPCRTSAVPIPVPRQAGSTNSASLSSRGRTDGSIRHRACRLGFKGVRRCQSAMRLHSGHSDPLADSWKLPAHPGVGGAVLNGGCIGGNVTGPPPACSFAIGVGGVRHDALRLHGGYEPRMGPALDAERRRSTFGCASYV